MEKNILPIKKAVLIFFVFACGYFVSALLRAITATLSPLLTSEFNLNAGDLGLLAGGYFLGFATMQIPLGYLLDSEEIEVNKISDASSEAFILFDKEIKWRKDAAQNLMPELEKYNSVIKNNIGLRLQSRLTKEQAKMVARCNSIHRDISLNF